MSESQALALGSLGWSLRRIEEQTGVRRETAKRQVSVMFPDSEAQEAHGSLSHRVTEPVPTA